MAVTKRPASRKKTVNGVMGKALSESNKRYAGAIKYDLGLNKRKMAGNTVQQAKKVSTRKATAAGSGVKTGSKYAAGNAAQRAKNELSYAQIGARAYARNNAARRKGTNR